MRIASRILIVISVIGLAAGLAGIGNNMVSGFAIAMGAVTFALAFITRIVESAETA